MPHLQERIRIQFETEIAHAARKAYTISYLKHTLKLPYVSIKQCITRQFVVFQGLIN